ncbi:MAG: hypothetical protein ACJ79J_06940 [Gemmatimonadaceae bacterium]
MSTVATWVPATIRASQIAKNAAYDTADRYADDTGAPGVVSISIRLLVNTERVQGEDS